MCGIAGIVTQNGTPPDEGLLWRMSDSIAHRGPDGQAVWTSPGVGFAHRRLAIIDLSEEAAQPMHGMSGRFTIVFNGEIYNYRELRANLESSGARFRTSSDTEAILEGYRIWGIDVLKKLRGMFAFALWDGERKELLLVRDRIGKKPLYVARTPSGDFSFASEMKALVPAVALKPELSDIRLFLGLQYVPSPRTGFAGVSQLLPGSYGIWKNGEWKEEKYHEWNSECRMSNVDIDETIRTKLDDAVKIRQLAADVPVGAFLSGGIDSAAVVAFASKHVSRPLQTFTMGFPELHMDERREARAIAKQFGTDHQEFEARPEHLQALVEELISHYDAPYADSSALPLWLLAQETAKEIKVVLTGDGGAELFGGYRANAAYANALQLSRIPGTDHLVRFVGKSKQDPRFLRMAETIQALRANPGTAYGELFCGSYFGSLALHDTFDPEFLAQTDASDAVRFVGSQMAGAGLQAAMHFDLTSYLPDDLNVKMDRATMRFGLEARAPFLDQELVQYALSLPLKQKVDHGKSKVALKRALKGIVPDDVLHRPKRGFQVPLAEWFRGPLRELVRSRCLDPELPLAKIVRKEAVERLIRDNDRGADHGNRLWMLLSLSTWLSKYAT